MKVMLIASTGGHLSQLVQLRPWWERHERHWVTFDKGDARASLAGEKTTWAYHPTTRNLKNAIRNFFLAIKVLISDRPDLIVSTGAGLAVPFFLVARILRIRTAFIEVFDRIELPTLTAKMVYPITDLFAVQWPQQKESFPEAALMGRLL